jgi:hypothetical protein
MPPEEIPLLIAVDFKLDNGKLVGREERIEHQRGQLMFASWYANVQPQGYRPVCGGVVYVQESDIRETKTSDKRPSDAGKRYIWRDTNRPDGVMFVMILPEGHTLREPNPLPYEAKNFQGRLAVHWRTQPAEGQFEVSWRVERLASKDMNVEVQRINKIIFASRPAGAMPEYDVALSYASEDRDYVEKVAAALKVRYITVFDYRDEEQAVATWGMDLYQCLSDIYSNSPWRKWRVFCKADDVAGYAIPRSTSQGTRRSGFRKADSGLSDPGRVNKRTKQACQGGFSTLAACPRPATGAGSGSG